MTLAADPVVAYTDPRVQLPSEAFGVILHNALAFCPASSRLPRIYLEVTPEWIFAYGTDTFAAGRDQCAPFDSEFLYGETFKFEIDRQDAVDMEYVARMDKKGTGLLVVHPDYRVTFAPQGAQEPLTVAAHPADDQLWPAVDDMLAAAHQAPDKVAFQPQLLQRIAKVKADKEHRVADVAISDPGQPVLFKIGPTFKGLVMPVQRDRYSRSFGEDGLWN